MTTTYVEMSSELEHCLDGMLDGGPSGNDLIRFYKEQGYTGASPHRECSAFLTRKRAVPEVIGLALIDYLNAAHGLRLTREECLRDTNPPSDFGWWGDQASWVKAFLDPFREQEKMLMRDAEKATILAARWQLDSVGTKLAALGESTSPSACAKRGEEKMFRTEEEYTRWMRRFVMTPGYLRTFMFYLRKNRRIGMIGTFPLKESTWKEIAAGNKFDGDLTPDDLQLTSRYLYNHGMSDAERIPKLRTHEKTLAQLRTVMYQYAYFTRNLKSVRPMILSPACCHYYQELLEMHGYMENGNTMKGTNTPLMIYAHAADGGSRRIIHREEYALNLFLLGRYRRRNRAKWDAEDKEANIRF